MSMHKRMLFGFGAACAVAGVVWACGPDFPQRLLDERGASLKAAPMNGFRWEAQHLLVATDALKPNESPYNWGEPLPPVTDAGELGLSPAQLQRVTALRQSADGAAAYAQGHDLPEDLRLYTAAAIDYSRARGSCDSQAGASVDATAAGEAAVDVGEAAAEAAPATSCSAATPAAMDDALAGFHKVLALPTAQASLRSVWAAYMLGRIHAERAAAQAADVETFKRERELAGKAFQLSRERALAGGSDTQGLAVASFGEEARLYLHNGSGLCGWSQLRNDGNTCGVGIAPADLKHAIALYAAQAGHGSDGAVNSLDVLARDVLGDSTRTLALLDDPVSQRLLVAYAMAYLGSGRYEGDDEAARRNAQEPRWNALLQAIGKLGAAHVARADRLAVLAYRLGQYDQAAALAAGAQGPLARWVQAKLALQKGDLAAAAAAYAEAAKAFPAADDSAAAIRSDNVPLITGERGVLALARGEYVEAMGHLYDAAEKTGGSGDFLFEEGSGGRGYAGDVGYIAERVLTEDELKAFVDARVPATPPPSTAPDPDAYSERPLADNLRWLLARRLLRSGRFDEAMGYFPAPGDRRFGEVDLRAKATAYAKAIRDATRAWTDIGKAEAHYAAAAIAREHGMELLGYEQAPDHAEYEGMFAGDARYVAEGLTQDFVTEGERQRFAASAAKPLRRFHYRYIAADHAIAAADLLPPRSQAFAAMLCTATGWMRQGPPDPSDSHAGSGDTGPATLPESRRRELAYYQRYVAQGAYVPWAVNFGKHCEAPDFAGARSLLRHERLVEAKRLARRWLPYGAGGLALLVAAAVLWRRRRAAPG